MPRNSHLKPKGARNCRCRVFQHGAASIEYALLASLICLVIVSSVGVVGVEVRTLYDNNEKSIVAAIKAALGRLGA